MDVFSDIGVLLSKARDALNRDPSSPEGDGEDDPGKAPGRRGEQHGGERKTR